MLKKERTEYFTNFDKPIGFNRSWMKYIDDNTLIHNLSIPGTHDSCARHGTLLAETQSWSIYSQLEAGIRYFDIRLRQVKDALLIYHGPTYQFISFGDVLNEINEYFSIYKEEGIMMRIRQEGAPLNPKGSIIDVFNKYLLAFPKLFLFSDSYPKLKDIRSKVWVLKDNIEFVLSTKKFFSLDVQDFYNLEKHSIEEKEKIILEYFDKSDISTTEMIANHLSATGIPVKTPTLIAKQTNKTAYENIDKHKKLGIIIMDFPGEDLIFNILNKN